MALQGSGAINMTQIKNEFDGNSPHGLSEYWALDSGAGLPGSGPIKFSDFYNKKSDHTYTANRTQEVTGLSAPGDHGLGVAQCQCSCCTGTYYLKHESGLNINNKIINSITIEMESNLDYGFLVWVNKNGAGYGNFSGAQNPRSSEVMGVFHGPAGQGNASGTTTHTINATANDTYEFAHSAGHAWQNNYNSSRIKFTYVETVPVYYTIST